MGPVIAIFKKDMRALMTSSMFYILMGLCCCLWALFFSFQVYGYVQQSYQLSLKGMDVGLNIHQNLMASYVVIVHYVLVFIIAAMSIRFFAEEKKLKTFPILLSSPLTSWQILLAKWLVGASLILMLLFISALLPLSLLFFASLPLKLFFLSYLGLFLVLSVYMSAALFASSMTESMIVCVVLSLVLNIFLMMLGVGEQMTDNLTLQSLFDFLSFDQHFQYFRVGLLNPSSILYFLSWSFFFSLLAERVIEFHRWR